MTVSERARGHSTLDSRRENPRVALSFKGPIVTLNFIKVDSLQTNKRDTHSKVQSWACYPGGNGPCYCFVFLLVSLVWCPQKYASYSPNSIRKDHWIKWKCKQPRILWTIPTNWSLKCKQTVSETILRQFWNFKKGDFYIEFWKMNPGFWACRAIVTFFKVSGFSKCTHSPGKLV